jgi:hypothetical protein
MANFKDSLSMFEFLDQFVKVKLKEKSEPIFGWLYTIDPVSNRYLFLCLLAKNSFNFNLILKLCLDKFSERNASRSYCCNE